MKHTRVTDAVLAGLALSLIILFLGMCGRLGGDVPYFAVSLGSQVVP